MHVEILREKGRDLTYLVLISQLTQSLISNLTY